MTKPSLAYRRNAKSIWEGHVPAKFARLLSYIPHRNRVLEIGAAEGVLALLLAEVGCDVVAIEMRPDRHKEAVRLQEQWKKLGRHVDSCKMVQGDILDNIDLLYGVETLVAVRSIYYLRHEAPRVMAWAAAAGINHVVLAGNRNRAERWLAGKFPEDDRLGPWNRYASVHGMSELITGAGYRIDDVAENGDPIVTGRRD